MSPTPEFRLGVPIDDPDRLWARRRELNTAVASLRGELDDRLHVAIMGGRGGGKSSLLRCAGVKAIAGDSGGAVAWWRLSDHALSAPGLAWRSLLSGLVEGCADELVAQRWRERTWLGSRREPDELDRLTSGLVYGRSESVPVLDPHVLIHDLRALAGMYRRSPDGPCILCIDDAEALTEDMDLLEELVDALDAGGWVLALAGSPAMGRHMVQARSTLARRIRPIPLRPLPLHEVERCLAHGERLRSRLPSEATEKFDLVVSVARLTGGSPLLVSYVAQAMHRQVDELGLEHLELSLPVLRHTLAGLQALRFKDDDLNALTRLSEKNLSLALSVVPYERLTVEELAIARVLRIESAEDTCPRDSVGEDEKERAVARLEQELESLSDLGVVQFDQGARRFRLSGGIAAHVLYETCSRELLGRSTTRLPFGFDFISLVGSALVRTNFDAARAEVEGGECLARTRVRGAADFETEQVRPVIEALDEGRAPELGGVYLVPQGSSGSDLVETIMRSGDGALILVSGTVRGDGGELEYAELWAREVPSAGLESLHTALMEQHVALEDHFTFTGLRSAGCRGTVQRGDAAVKLACSLFPGSTHAAIIATYQDGNVERSRELAATAVEAVNTLGVTEPFDRDDELGELRNKLGFLNLASGRAADAEAIFRQVHEWSLAKQHPVHWLHEWNLAQAQAAQGNFGEAVATLDAALSAVPDDGASDVFLLCSSLQKLLAPLHLKDEVTDEVLSELIRAQQRLLTPEDDGGLGPEALRSSTHEPVRAMGAALEAQTA